MMHTLLACCGIAGVAIPRRTEWCKIIASACGSVVAKSTCEAAITATCGLGVIVRKPRGPLLGCDDSGAMESRN